MTSSLSCRVFEMFENDHGTSPALERSDTAYSPYQDSTGNPQWKPKPEGHVTGARHPFHSNPFNRCFSSVLMCVSTAIYVFLLPFTAFEAFVITAS